LFFFKRVVQSPVLLVGTDDGSIHVYTPNELTLLYSVLDECDAAVLGMVRMC
jgi:hypothetical protein